MPTRIVILGTAGRDFHNFNMVYRDDPGVQVVALEKPVVRARYEFADAGEPTLASLVDAFLARGVKGWHNEAGASQPRCDTDA